jgi:hypothetical protein
LTARSLLFAEFVRRLHRVIGSSRVRRRLEQFAWPWSNGDSLPDGEAARAKNWSEEPDSTRAALPRARIEACSRREQCSLCYSSNGPWRGPRPGMRGRLASACSRPARGWRYRRHGALSFSAPRGAARKYVYCRADGSAKPSYCCLGGPDCHAWRKLSWKGSILGGGRIRWSSVAR